MPVHLAAFSNAEQTIGVVDVALATSVLHAIALNREPHAHRNSQMMHPRICSITPEESLNDANAGRSEVLEVGMLAKRHELQAAPPADQIPPTVNNFLGQVEPPVFVERFVLGVARAHRRRHGIVRLQPIRNIMQIHHEMRPLRMR